jgi:hypothetical protein
MKRPPLLYEWLEDGTLIKWYLPLLRGFFFVVSIQLSKALAHRSSLRSTHYIANLHIFLFPLVFPASDFTPRVASCRQASSLTLTRGV